MERVTRTPAGATAAGATPAEAHDGERMDVRFRSGESYEVAVRGHLVRVDQPAGAGGEDSAPTPTELFVASLATCVAFYAGRYLTRHGYGRDGLGVSVRYELADDRPARVTDVRLTVQVPADLPPGRWPALQAVASHCTVHNSVTSGLAVTVELTRPASGASPAVT
jgi:putative redox protein